ncbi:MAG TPA: OmpA family protein [Flavobacteriaceae bacterium]|jgi:OOP family OmpA-OmpF porin|nr:cell envelope biogenesis protein OmpA [Flavobacteriaceae bacterium]MAM28958.1 cell envelope biogenesis protein OmpA [Flavobacteriaceae bacterium]HIB47916.1 OmpA family protein [Flavobacteriaceae bacterium]HIN99354.1 OmpA family protein [Flavobacteriaceae bacterium]|tara:strand:+ start:151050 stop:152336 length:1287 start_codon:yes stop_codon:yes gene_type:complete
MKKITLTLCLALAGLILHAQEDTSQAYDQYNKWSIELSGGLHKPTTPYADGYFIRGASPFQGSLGVRYMFNEKFGIRTVLGYTNIDEDNGEGSLPFESTYYRGTLEGVVNMGNVLDFSDWTDTFGLLIHAGAGYSRLDFKAPNDNLDAENLANISVGITPQIKISERVAFNVDVTMLGNVGLQRTWDGTAPIVEANRKFDDGLLYNFSAGLTVYLGKNDRHADWFSMEDARESKIEELENRLAKIETDLIDTDQDGVPDYLDREPNTMSGVAVNTKGIAVDKNENGIPDEIESSLDQRYVNEEDYVRNTGGGLDVKSLLDKGYVNVYFRFNSTTPETYSLEAINYLATYMKENPSANAELIGYADEIGDPTYNKNLSEKRAAKVKEILVASGISGNRLTVTGNGEDTSVEKGSAPARQLVRRVTFKLK